MFSPLNLLNLVVQDSKQFVLLFTLERIKGVPLMYFSLNTTKKKEQNVFTEPFDLQIFNRWLLGDVWGFLKIKPETSDSS